MADFTLDDIEQELASRGLGAGAEGLQFTGTTGRSATNNNPLNLEYRPGSYQDKYGAELEPQPRGGSKPRFAKFPNMMAGYLAGLDQIRLDQSPQRGHTLASFVNKFAPPHENPTQQIVNQYAKALGVTPDTPLAEIPPEKLIVPMLARESSTRIVGPREKDIFNALLAKRTAPAQRAFQPYQIAAAGEQIPGPPSQGLTLADIDAEIASRQQTQPQQGITQADIDRELAARQQPATPSAFSTPGGLLDNFFRPFPADRKQQMIQSILTPPENVGYRPEIVRPMVNALGLGGGGLLGTAGGGPLGGLAGAGLGFGLSQKAADFLDTYLGGKPAPTLTESLGQTAKEVPIGMMMQGYGEVAAPALQGAIKGLGAIAKPIIGRLGGTGVKNVEEALTGGQTFTDALRGKVSGEDVVQTFKDATQSIKDVRAARYQQQLAELSPPPGTTGWDIDTSPIQNHLRDQMNLFRIKVNPEGVIDTSVSALNESGRKDATKIIDEVWNWPDKSPLGLDALKRRLDDFYSESSKARAFVTSMRNKVKDVLTENVPGYAEMTKDYAEASTFIKDIEAGLMQRKQGLTGRVTADMALRRITSAMRDNFNMRGELVDALGAKTGEDLSGLVAGFNMRSIVPHGLAGSSAGALGSTYLSIFNPKILPILVAASPRAQGEFLRMFGKGLAETKGISIPVAKVQTYLALMPKTQKILEEENK